MSKTVELIKEAIPQVSRIGVFANSIDPFAQPFVSATEAAAGALGIGVTKVMATPADDPEPYLRSMLDSNVDVLIIQPTLLRPGIAELAQKIKLPTISLTNGFPHAGGLMSYASNSAAQWRQSAAYVDRILKGQRPADLPVVQPTRFDLIVNLKVAKILGLALPVGLIARADAVIE